MLTVWCYVFDVVFSQIKKTDQQDCSCFNPWRLLINKSNRFHKSTYKELLEKVCVNSASEHNGNSHFLTMELYEVLKGFSPDVVKEALLLNYASVLNPDALSQ